MWIDKRTEEWTHQLVQGKPCGEVHQYLGFPESIYQSYQRGEYTHLAGSDEVGWGALAGPLIVVALRAPLKWSVKGLKDSKEFRGKHRYEAMEEVYVRILKAVRSGEVQYNAAYVNADRIDELGPRTALRLAHSKALELSGAKRADTIGMVDGRMDLPFLCGSLPKADSIIPQVMAASIIAKYSHDNYMRDMATTYPQYGFDTNVGYNSTIHMEALKKYGPCPLHRRSYLTGHQEVLVGHDEHGEPRD